VLVPLDEAAVRAAARRLAGEGVQAVALVFLFSYRNPEHEQRAAAIVAEELPGVAISVSHRLTQEWREYERTSTTVVNAYVLPIVDRYLGAFGSRLGERGFRGRLLITQSNGGAFSVDAARAKPVHTIESGPAAGAVGCAALAAVLGLDRLISFDMGGTTAKCAIVEHGMVQITDEYHVDGRPLRIPVIDIREVSAGGGTIAWIDAGGALTLGPQSAGAEPGPVCYKLGGAEPTVTDANVVLGRIDGSRFLGGTMPLDAPAAARVVEDRLAKPLGLTRVDAAAGVVRLADVKMALAVRSITAARGLDPRDYALAAYGGGGPLHAVAIARELGIPRVVIPPAPSTFSAWGMLATDLRHDLVRTVLEPLEPTDATWAQARYAEMEQEIAAILPWRGQARHAARRRPALSRPGAHGHRGARGRSTTGPVCASSSTTRTSAPTATPRRTSRCSYSICASRSSSPSSGRACPGSNVARLAPRPPRRARSTRCWPASLGPSRLPARRPAARGHVRRAGRHRRAGHDDHHRRGRPPVGRGARLPDDRAERHRHEARMTTNGTYAPLDPITVQVIRAALNAGGRAHAPHDDQDGLQPHHQREPRLRLRHLRSRRADDRPGHRPAGVPGAIWDFPSRRRSRIVGLEAFARATSSSTTIPMRATATT
jgi:hypothetical protein